MLSSGETWGIFSGPPIIKPVPDDGGEGGDDRDSGDGGRIGDGGRDNDDGSGIGDDAILGLPPLIDHPIFFPSPTVPPFIAPELPMYPWFSVPPLWNPIQDALPFVPGGRDALEPGFLDPFSPDFAAPVVVPIPSPPARFPTIPANRIPPVMEHTVGVFTISRRADREAAKRAWCRSVALASSFYCRDSNGFIVVPTQCCDCAALTVNQGNTIMVCESTSSCTGKAGCV